jgi:hypothetical protein
MTGSIENLDAELADAFPAVKLSPAVFTAAKLWSAYTNDRSFEKATDGRAWNELSREVVEAHAAALGYMDPDTFIALLPAYLLVLEESENELPPLVLGELTRKDEFAGAFDARTARMTTQQRSVVARVLARLANTEQFARNYASEVAAAVSSWRSVAVG